MGDYIKINRSILEWEWFHDINTFRLFVYMILKANWKDGKFEGKIIKRGSLVSSFNNLSIETDLTVREVRTAISHLKTTSEVTSKAYSKYTVFTVVNYDLYQSSDKQTDIQATSNRHSNDILTTTIEEGKEVKKGSKSEIAQKEANELFEILWKIYPCKRGKGQISDVKKIKLAEIGPDELNRAIDRYKADLKKESWREPQNGSTFFSSGYIDYLDNNYSPVQTAAKTNSFGDFKQKDYDFEAIEKKLTGGALNDL